MRISEILKQRGKGIGIPILPGIMPVADLRKIRKFASFCGATIPSWMDEKLAPYLNQPGEMEKIGIDMALRQCQELLDQGVSYLHFYTLNRSDAVKKILDALKGRLG